MLRRAPIYGWLPTDAYAQASLSLGHNMLHLRGHRWLAHSIYARCSCMLLWDWLHTLQGESRYFQDTNALGRTTVGPEAVW
jgi:membrane-bound metal-dependent hydrolase YbcI (DUF457 family)